MRRLVDATTALPRLALADRGTMRGDCSTEASAAIAHRTAAIDALDRSQRSRRSDLRER
jgi:hypothetical protein